MSTNENITFKIITNEIDFGYISDSLHLSKEINLSPSISSESSYSNSPSTTNSNSPSTTISN